MSSLLLRRPFSTSSLSKPLKSISEDLYKERNLKRLVEKFKNYSESDRFRTKTGIYVETIRRLASAKRFRWIEEVLEDQKKYRDISKEGFSARLIFLYGQSGMFDRALKMFDGMPEHKCDRTVTSFNALLGACVNSKKFDKVDGFFRELPGKLSIKPDVVSYNTVIKAFCEMGSFDSAVLMLDEMEKAGLEPDVITFNTLLDGFYGKTLFSDGEKIWFRMIAKNVLPNIRSYNAKLLGLAFQKNISEAVELIGEMDSKGFKLDVFSFNALIKGYCNEGNLVEAKKWYKELLKSDCAPNRATFDTLASFLCENGDFGYLFELSKEFLNKKCLVDGALLQLVVDGLIKESKVEEANKLVQIGNSNGYCRYNLKLP